MTNAALTDGISLLIKLFDGFAAIDTACNSGILAFIIRHEPLGDLLLPLR